MGFGVAGRVASARTERVQRPAAQGAGPGKHPGRGAVQIRSHVGGDGGPTLKTSCGLLTLGLLLALLRGAKVSRGRVETCGVIWEARRSRGAGRGGCRAGFEQGGAVIALLTIAVGKCRAAGHRSELFSP